MSNYSSMKLEFVALKWAMTEKFREYLLGNKCVVFTNNNHLSHLTSVKLGATEQRWASQLVAFDFEIKYRSGKSNRNAGALSRRDPLEPGGLDGLTPGTAIPESLRSLAGVDSGGIATQCMVSTLPGYSAGDLRSLQAADPVIWEVLRFWRQGNRPGPNERRQMTKAALTLVLPAALRPEVLRQLHQQHGHQGRERTMELVQQRCYWPGLSSDVGSWCHECDRCQAAKDTQPLAQAFMGRLMSSRPNDILAVDFTVLKFSVSIPLLFQRGISKRRRWHKPW
ncbi:uncharacterized protein LOC124399768 [Silurus meridionalis]|uniref:uncharacterized protein LOC124399768 n=1 Tax=Silurus meridionalis TaxID=175797 RepID=UPI001EEAE48C|nr:uncharacterized protein LOC124399768 [Silurus meridionalis]